MTSSTSFRLLTVLISVLHLSATRQPNCTVGHEASPCPTDVEPLKHVVTENQTSSTGRAVIAGNGISLTHSHDVPSTKIPDAAPTKTACCNNQTDVVQQNHLGRKTTQIQKDNIPLWAIMILAISVLLGVIGVAILILFIFFSVKQKDQQNKKQSSQSTAKSNGTNGVVARSRDLNHSCTVIMDMADTDSTQYAPHGHTKQDQRTASICLHTADNKIIDVPLSADGYAIPCEVKIRDSVVEPANQPAGNESDHDYEEVDDVSEVNWESTNANIVSHTRPATHGDRHTIPREHNGFHGFSLPYAKVNLSMKKHRKQVAQIRARLASHESEISYADLDFGTIRSPDLVLSATPPVSGQYSDVNSLRTTTRASTIDYGELDRHRAFMQVFAFEDSEPESLCSSDEESPQENQRNMLATTL